MLVGDGALAAKRVITSADGSSWTTPTAIPAMCAADSPGKAMRHFGGIGALGDCIVIVAEPGTVCHSDYAGLNWVETSSLGRGVTSHDAVTAGGRLYVWSRGATTPRTA